MISHALLPRDDTKWHLQKTLKKDIDKIHLEKRSQFIYAINHTFAYDSNHLTVTPTSNNHEWSFISECISVYT